MDGVNAVNGNVTAGELRGRAWRALSRGNDFLRFFLGLFTLNVLLTLGVLAAAAVFVGGAAGMSVLAQSMGADPEKDIFLLSLANLVPASVLVLGVLYAVGYLTWGQTAMGVATMRGGLSFSHAFSGWGNGWRTVSLLLWQSTFVTLWALLFIVPGIRAAFSYALAPYLLVDHPDWTPRQCIAESKRLMEGHRWRFFCLNFSFFGWYILVAAVNAFVPFVGGLAGYAVQAYVQTGTAAFYEDMLDREDARKARA